MTPVIGVACVIVFSLVVAMFAWLRERDFRQTEPPADWREMTLEEMIEYINRDGEENA